MYELMFKSIVARVLGLHIVDWLLIRFHLSFDFPRRKSICTRHFRGNRGWRFGARKDVGCGDGMIVWRPFSMIIWLVEMAGLLMGAL